MKKPVTAAAKMIASAALLLAASNAMAGHVSVGIHIGVPGVVVQPAPVYAPVYVEPRPVYVERVYAQPVYPPAYREPVYVEHVYVQPRPAYVVERGYGHGRHRHHHGYAYRGYSRWHD